MSTRNILVAFNGTGSSVTALRYAADMARQNGGHVTALLAHATHQTLNSRAAYVPASARQIIEDAEAQIITQICDQFEGLREELGLGDALHFMRQSGRVDAVLSEAARLFDLLVIGLDDTESVDEHVLIHADRIALMSGRPLLLVPNRAGLAVNHANAALAWDGSRAAARALSDALSLLEDSGHLSLVTVGPAKGDIETLETHVARHGIGVKHVALPDKTDIAAALLEYCAQHEPHLLVMGAYEHSKFREDFLGGVTASVFKGIRIPVLMSH